ncbi:MAG: hypothetical protein FJ137_05640 [Deltaproteobacteria bacterium]|nr:hypothetical protein [Deltaproteobacteria bacterium]
MVAAAALALFAAVVGAPVAVDSELERLPPHDRVLAEARRALAARDPQGTLHLWLLHRAMPWDASFADESAFLSTVWVATGETGVCPDGLPDDAEGARLWPVALHNWLLARVRRGPPDDLPPTWGTFPVRLQTRPISLFDTLSLEELRTARLVVGPCNAHLWATTRLPTLHWMDLQDRLSVGLVLHELLLLAERVTDPTLVRGKPLLAARRFDLNASLTRLARDRARADTTLAATVLRSSGLATDGLVSWQQERARTFATGTTAGFWQVASSWPASTWLDLPTDRRAGLFVEAREALRAAGAEERIVLGVLEGVIDRRDGDDVQRWLGAVDGLPDAPAIRARLMTGDVGARLLSLSPDDGFRERAVVSLHRGVDRVQAGESLAALRSFADALATAETSTVAGPVHDLTLRWFSFVVGSYEATPAVLEIVERFVPGADHGAVLEAVLWRALFRGDVASYERATALLPRGAREQRARFALLAPIAGGDVDAAFGAFDDALHERPRAMLDLAARLLDRLADEPATLRARHAPSLQRLLPTLEKTASTSESKARRATAEKLAARAQAMLESIGRWRQETSARARAHAPDYETDAGALRLAPADPLPWPFAIVAPRPMDPFTPIRIVPVRWRGPDGAVVQGWSLRE